MSSAVMAEDIMTTFIHEEGKHVEARIFRPHVLYLGQKEGRSEETADSPAGNTEHWCQGSCGEKLSVLFVWANQINAMVV